MLCDCISGCTYLLCELFVVCFFFFKQKTAYEMRISDWSSDVCSSDLSGTCLESERDVVGQVQLEPPGGHRGDPCTWAATPDRSRAAAAAWKIGRASGRERVCQYV